MDRHDLRWTMSELGFLGFPKAHRDEIELKMNADPDKFNIAGKKEFQGMKGMESIDYTIYFKKYDKVNAYHPYMYHAALPNKGRSQNFRIVQDAGFSLPDAFNLLQGRAVHKLVIDHQERKLKPYWFQLDLSGKDIHGNYPITKHQLDPFELSIGRELEARGVKEMLNPTKRVNLVLSLYYGNAEPVTIRNGDKDHHAFAAVFPKERSVKLLNSDGNELTVEAQRAMERKHLQPVAEQLTRSKRRGRGI